MALKLCSKCCMNTSDADIVFDDKGICNHCHNAQKMLKEIEAEKPNLKNIINKIKNEKGRYNCLIGLSGGVDSSLTLHHAVRLGLKPLCFSVDNGYNTKESDENIMRLVEGLKVPFYRYIINQDEFRYLQRAFIEANILNIEVCTDHILMATTYEMANKYGIKYILSGGNVETESVMPKSFGYSAWDLRHIKAVAKANRASVRELPTCSLLKYNYYRWIKRIETIYLLDYYDYNRQEAIKILKEKYGYRPYGEKHCESEFTKWFQEIYLPQFGIDKRRAHYSSLINSGQMTRKQALKLLKDKPIKLGNKKPVSYKEYPNNEKLYNFISKLVRTARKWR